MTHSNIPDGAGSDSAEADRNAGSATETCNTTDESPPVRVGQQLRAARQRRQLDLETCAARLRLPVRVLRQLEAGDHAGIDCGLYLRNYLASYGECVGLDRETINTAIAQLAPAERKPALVSTGGVSRSRYLWQRWTTAATYAVLTGVIVVPLVWLGIKGGLDRELTHLEPLNSAPVAQNDAAGSAPAPSGSSDAPRFDDQPSAEQPLMASMAPFSALDANELPRKVATPAIAVDRTDAIIDKDKAAAPASASRAGHTLAITLSKPSWVEVTTASGKRLEYSLLAAGTHKAWHSSQALHVSIGDTRGAHVTLDGNTLDLGDYEHANVAHFRIALNDGKARVSAM